MKTKEKEEFIAVDEGGYLVPKYVKEFRWYHKRLPGWLWGRVLRLPKPKDVCIWDQLDASMLTLPVISKKILDDRTIDPKKWGVAE